MIHKDQDDGTLSESQSASQENSDSSASGVIRPDYYAMPATILKGLAWSIALFFILLTLPLLALQIESGQNLLAKGIGRMLSGPNSRVEIHNLRGQVPFDMRIGYVRLADRQGVWLEIEQLHFAWSLAKLVHGHIQINSLGAERLHVYREPQQSNSTPQAQSTSNTPTTGSFPAFLPSVLLDRLYVQHIILDKAAYGKDAHFSLQGQVKHMQDGATQDGAAQDGAATDDDRTGLTSLIAKLELHPLDAGETQLTLEGKLSPISLSPISLIGTPPVLELAITGHERSGLTASLTGLAQAKEMDIHLAGKGPVSAWEGTLAVTVAGLGSVQAQLGLAHLFQREPEKHPTLSLQGNAYAEKGWINAKLADLWRTPQQDNDGSGVKKILDDRPTVYFALQTKLPDPQHLFFNSVVLKTAFATLHGQGQLGLLSQDLEIHAKLDMPRMAAITPLTGTPLAGHLSATMQVDGPWQQPSLKVTTQVDNLAVVDMRAKQLLANLEGHYDLFGTVGGAVGDAVGQPVTAIQITGQGSILGLHHAQDTSLPSKKTLTWSTDLTARTKQADTQNPIKPGLLHMTKLEIKDQGMTLLLRGDIDPERKSGQGDFQLKLARLSHLERVAALAGSTFVVAGVDGQAAFSGKFAFAQASPGKKAQAPWRLTVKGKLLKLQGLPPAAQTLLGSLVQTEAKLALWPGQKMVVTNLDIKGTALQMHGDLQADLIGGSIAGTVQTNLPELNLLAPLAGVPLAGNLVVDTLLSGEMTAPHLQITLHSDAIDIDRQHLKKASAILMVDTLESTANGTLKIDFNSRFNGIYELPVSIALSYRLEDPLLKISNLRIQLPGSKLTGKHLNVDLAQGLVDGQLQGRSDDLNPLVRWFYKCSQNSPNSPCPRNSQNSQNSQNSPSQNLSGTLEIQTHLKTQRGQRQGLKTSIKTQFVRGEFGILGMASLNADLDDLFGEARGKVEIIVGKSRWGKTRLRGANLTAQGKLTSANIILHANGQAQETFDVEANALLGIDGNGVIRGTLAGLTGTMGQDSLQLVEEAHITIKPSSQQQVDGPSLNLDQIKLRYGPAHLLGHAFYDAQRLDMALELKFPLGIAARFGGPDLQGIAQFSAKLGGSPNRPKGHMELLMDQIRINDPALDAIPEGQVVANALLDNGQVNANIALKSITTSPISTLLLFPLRLGFAPFHVELPAKGKIGGTLNADASLAQFALMAALDTQKLDGIVHIAMGLGGTVEAPTILGDFLLSNGSYENGTLGTVLREVNIKATAQGRTIKIDSLRASDGGDGRLSASGHVSLDSDLHFPFQVKATLENSMLIRRDELHSTMSGVLNVHGNSEKFKIESDLTSNELLFYLSETSGPDIKTVTIDTEIRNGLDISAEEMMLPVQDSNTQVDLDIAIHLPNRVFARGRGLESEWRGDLNIRGSVNDPLVLGQLLVKRGYFEFLNQHFDLRKGVVSFDGASPPQPNIDLEAETEANGVVALLHLYGPLFTPKLELDSEPELPHDEILARLLFNRNSQQLTPAQALGLLATVEKFRSGGPGVLGKARDSFGFDRLELDGDSVETGSVKAGKYLSDKVFIGVERGLDQGSGKVSVELELTPNITVETEMGENDDSGIGMNWKYDY